MKDIDSICMDKNIKLTELRKDILSILYRKNKPMGAYDILDTLKKKRPNAEPPTVYRVLEFLVDAKLVHRVESQNTYVCCSSILKEKTQHKAILLSCKVCHQSFEFEDDGVFLSIDKFAKKHKLEVDDALIEIKGVCADCRK